MLVRNWTLKLSAVALLPLLCAFQTPDYQPAQRGDNAAGEIVSRLADGSIILNTTPCGPAQTKIMFHNPFRMTREDPAACRTSGVVRNYQRAQIEQE